MINYYKLKLMKQRKMKIEMRNLSHMNLQNQKMMDYLIHNVVGGTIMTKI
jgi:hypothetical protein